MLYIYCNSHIIFFIKKIINQYKLKASQIWNCDESGFSHDPTKCMSVTIKGKIAYKVTCGLGRENTTTTLAVVNAAGPVLDPSIIFSGKNFQSAWK